jgi:hypothetical protein
MFHGIDHHNKDTPNQSDWEESDGIRIGSDSSALFNTPVACAVITSNRFHIPDQNLCIYAQCIAVHDKLRTDQVSCIEEFSDWTPAKREVQLFSKLHALENKIDTIRLSQPEYQVTCEMEVSNLCFNFSAVIFTLSCRPISRDLVLASSAVARP